MKASLKTLKEYFTEIVLNREKIFKKALFSAKNREDKELRKFFHRFKHFSIKKQIQTLRLSSNLTKVLNSYMKNYLFFLTQHSVLLMKKGFEAFIRNKYLFEIENVNRAWKWKLSNSDSKWYTKSNKITHSNKITIVIFDKLSEYFKETKKFAWNKLKDIIRISKALKKLKNYHTKIIKQSLIIWNYHNQSSKASMIGHYKTTLKNLLSIYQFNVYKAKSANFHKFERLTNLRKKIKN